LLAVRKERQTLVIRDGHVVNISTFDLVVGDIILIKQGDSISADCLLIESDELKTDESNITGESEHVKKAALNSNQKGNPFLLADSMVEIGKGKALVCVVGTMT
jgi:P-type E1-E2 ATPase